MKPKYLKAGLGFGTFLFGADLIRSVPGTPASLSIPLLLFGALAGGLFAWDVLERG